MTTKAKGTSIRQKIIDLGKALHVKPRDLETVFMIERLVVHFDLGIGDPITPGPQKKQTPPLLAGNEVISWLVYPIETICAEKLHALISHGDQNSRSKDVHDLAIFLPKAYAETLGTALERCFEFRRTEMPEKFSTEIKKINTHRLEQGWLNSVASVQNAPSFKTAFDSVVRQITQLEKSFK